MKFVNFDVSLEPRVGNGYPVLANSAKYGQARGLCQIEVNSPELQAQLDAISKEELDGPGLTALGKLLGANLFNGTVEELFSKIVGGVESQKKTGVRLRLRINAPELNVLPWEFLQTETGGDPLGTSTRTVVTRYIEFNDLVREVEAPKPLRMLGIIPEGSGLNTDNEKAALTKALAELGDSLQLTWLEGKVTRELIREKLGEAEYHIIHFIGHGYMDGTRASLRLTDEYGDDYPVPAETFAGFFRDSGVRLVVLNACRGAARSASDAALGVGPQVVRRGVPAVVAMQWDINDRVAQSFAKTFYRTLCIGPEAGEVDTAVTRGRAVLYDDWPGNRAFATPVLFLRAEDGRLWKGGEEEEQEDGKSIGSKRPVQQNVTQNIGVQVTGTVGGDVAGNKIIKAGGDVNMVEGGGTIIYGDTSAPSQPKNPLAAGIALKTQVSLWIAKMKVDIDGLSGLSDDEKNDLKEVADKIQKETERKSDLDGARLAKLINSLGLMGSEALVQMTAQRLGSPLLGVGIKLAMNTDSKVTVDKVG